MTKHNEHHISLEFGEVLKRSYKRAGTTFTPLLALIRAIIVAVISSVLFVGALAFGVFELSSSLAQGSLFVDVILFTLVIAYLFFALWTLMAAGIVNTKLLKYPTFDFLPLIKASWSEVPRVFSISLVAQLAVLGGLILGILPGIWLGIVLMFVFTTAVLDKTTFKQAVSKSAHLVRDNFWNVFAIVFFLAVVNFVIGLIPYIGSVIGILLSVFTSIVMYELYVTLEHNKGVSSDHTHHEKNILLVTKLFAFLALIAIAALVVIGVILISA